MNPAPIEVPSHVYMPVHVSKDEATATLEAQFPYHLELHLMSIWGATAVYAVRCVRQLPPIPTSSRFH